MGKTALLGIEYTFLVSLFLLILTLSGTTLAPGAPGGGDPGPQGNGGDLNPPGGGGAQPTPTPGPGGGGGTVTRKFLGGITIFQDDGDVITEPRVYQTPGTVTIGEELQGTAQFGNLNPQEAPLLIQPVAAQSNSLVLHLQPAGEIANAQLTAAEVPAPELAEIRLAAGRAPYNRNVFAAFDIITSFPASSLAAPVEARFTVDPLWIRLNTPDGDISRVGMAIYHPDSQSFTNVHTIVRQDPGSTGAPVLYSSSFFPASTFVIYAYDLATINYGCNNDDVCDPTKGETAATCIDCKISASPESTTCSAGSTLCIDNTVYTCVNDGKDLREGEKCPYGCANGACSTTPAPLASGVNTIILVMVVLVIVIGLVMATIFLRQ